MNWLDRHLHYKIISSQYIYPLHTQIYTPLYVFARVVASPAIFLLFYPAYSLVMAQLNTYFPWKLLTPADYYTPLGNFSKNIEYQCTGPTLRNPVLFRPEQQSSHILVASENLLVKTQMLNSTLKVSNWETRGLEGQRICNLSKYIDDMIKIVRDHILRASSSESSPTINSS